MATSYEEHENPFSVARFKLNLYRMAGVEGWNIKRLFCPEGKKLRQEKIGLLMIEIDVDVLK